MVFEQLRKRSREHHLRIKNGEYAKKIMHGKLTLEEYEVLIAANYFFHGTLERQISEQVPNHFLKEIDFKNRTKVPHIIADLIQLNIKPESLLNDIESNSSLPLPTINIDTEAKALAALYVVEGTAIGGAIIKKSLVKIYALNHLSFYFYGCYGSELSAKWKNFAKTFNERCENVDIEEEVIECTAGIFDFYEELITYCEQFLLEKKHSEQIDKSPMIFNLQNTEDNDKLVVLSWNNLPGKKEFYQDIQNINDLLDTQKDYRILLNFLMLGKYLNKPKEDMWEVTTLLNLLHYKKIKKIGVTIPEKTTGKVMVKQMLSELVEDHNVDIGFFDTLQECTLWSND